MTDLWQLVSRDFNSLTQIMSRVLSKSDAEFPIRQALDSDELPWAEIVQTYRPKESFPNNVIRLSLASDCLHVMTLAMRADGMIDEVEVRTAYSLSQPLLKVLGSIERYSKYTSIDNDDTLDLLRMFINDRMWFGGHSESPTKLLGLKLSSLISAWTSKPNALETYGRIILAIITGVFGGEPRTDDERSLLETFRNLVSTTASDGEFNDSKATLSTSGSSYALRDSDKSIDKTLEDSFAQELSRSELEAVAAPGQTLEEAMSDLDSLIGLDGIKAEVKRLTSFLRIQQHRKQHGLKGSVQTLHFVFTGNPGTGKTTVARIVSKILYGFCLLKTTNVVECDRSDLVGGYLGQTAIKTDEKIESALDGVLFIDEAYTLAGDALNYGHGDMYGDEAINTLVKRMEDSRDRLVVIVAGYPKPMQKFIRANPGLESRFTRYLTFEDYSIADLCRIFEKFCREAEYNLSATGRAFACILFTVAYNQRDERFGNARFIRNVFERATSLQSERLANLPHDQISREMLVTLDGSDISFEFVKNVTASDIDISNARWAAECPGCGNTSNGTSMVLGRLVNCKQCKQTYTCPWWKLIPETIVGIPTDLLKSTVDCRGILEQPELPLQVETINKPIATTQEILPPRYDRWVPDRDQGSILLEEGLYLLRCGEFGAAIKCFDEAICVDWPGSDIGVQPYYQSRALAYQLTGDERPYQALEDYNGGIRSRSMGHYKSSRDAYLSAINKDRNLLWASNNLAWLYATCEDSRIRNGSEAVRHATYACHESDWHCWHFIDTLAASYAEAGEFDKAVKCSERSLMLAPPERKESLQEMLELFKSQRPHRED
jgi:SpoVK/Ycf46/Vps4 family AAA+-type ATPase